MNIAQQFIEVLKRGIIAHVGLKRDLTIAEKALCMEINVRETFEDTHCKLETQLKESKLENSMAVKIHTKEIVTQEVTEKEFNQLYILLVEEQATQTKEKE